MKQLLKGCLHAVVSVLHCNIFGFGVPLSFYFYSRKLENAKFPEFTALSTQFTYASFPKVSEFWKFTNSLSQELYHFVNAASSCTQHTTFQQNLCIVVRNVLPQFYAKLPIIYVLCHLSQFDTHVHIHTITPHSTHSPNTHHQPPHRII